MVGIIQEQHPERARLFMQWKQMDWPVLVDSQNALGIEVVPVTLALDEHGIIRHGPLRLADAESIQETFLDQDYEPSDPSPPKRAAAASLEPPAPDAKAAAWRAYANALAVWGREEQQGLVIDAFERALALDPGHGPTHFRLGVAYRRRYDSPHHRPGDFGRAVRQWRAALETNPNQYIWRRRIQQYGPRLDKPYPFYDWVTVARQEIQARGLEPLPLSVEPRGAEFTMPAERFAAAEESTAEPDPQGRIVRDPGNLVSVETTVVPDTNSGRASARVHVVLRPNLENQAHWNNEVDPLVVWIRPPAGWQLDRRRLTVAGPPEAVSQETRTVEFELLGPDGAEGLPEKIGGYALYYVCEDVDGSCLYRRQDIDIRPTF
jgi:tetratricopeptide (TPR) repeat protein